MQCRNCGTEIADKAIVCYRCGHATTDPVRKAVPLKARRNPLIFLVVAAILAVLAIAVGYGARTAADPDTWKALAGVLGGAAAMILVLGILRRR
jgi:hypothetical protein